MILCRLVGHEHLCFRIFWTHQNIFFLKVVSNWQQFSMREADIQELLKGLARIIARLDSMLLLASQETGEPLDTAPVTAALDSLVGPMLVHIQTAMAQQHSPSELFCRLGVVFKHLNIRYLHARDHPGIATIMQVCRVSTSHSRQYFL
jgi:hypothetical protein